MESPSSKPEYVDAAYDMCRRWATTTGLESSWQLHPMTSFELQAVNTPRLLECVEVDDYP